MLARLARGCAYVFVSSLLAPLVSGQAIASPPASPTLPPAVEVPPGLRAAFVAAHRPSGFGDGDHGIASVAQEAYLKASNTDAFDFFGSAVAISGDTAVIGARSEDSAATTVNGDQSDDSAFTAGAAYVFVRDGSTWSQQAYLKASNAETADAFGWSVAIAGDTIAVGAIGEDSAATGIDGNQANNAAAAAGAVYVFVRTGTTWSQQAYLKASNAEANDEFGYSLAAYDDTLVVGAHQEDGGATGVNGDHASNAATESGAAYVFTRLGTTWSQQAYLKASNTDAYDYFGQSVALWANTAVVGAWLEDSDATGVNGDDTDDSAGQAGAAYVFARSAGTWTQQAYLKASNTEAADRFGTAVAIAGDTVVIGAREEDSAAFGVDGNQFDNSVLGAGAAYVFERTGSFWTQDHYLKASNPDIADNFGHAVAMSPYAVAIGARHESSGAIGIDGDELNNSKDQAGAAYVFERARTTWSQLAYAKASNTDPYDQFGSALALADDTLLVGAWGEDSGATGVNGDQSGNDLGQAGAAYVLDLDMPPVAHCAWYCGTGVNAATDGFVVTSPPVLGDLFRATVTGCAPGNAGALLAAYAAPLTFPSPFGEVLHDFTHPAGELLGHPFAPGNPAAFVLPVPNDVTLAGLAFYTQAASFGGSVCFHCAYACVIGY